MTPTPDTQPGEEAVRAALAPWWKQVCEFTKMPGIPASVAGDELVAIVAKLLSAPAAGGVDAGARSSGCFDKDGNELFVGDHVRYCFAGSHTKVEYWNPEYEIIFDAPSFTLKHIGGGKDGGQHLFILKHGRVNGDLVLIKRGPAPLSPAPTSGSEAGGEAVADAIPIKLAHGKGGWTIDPDTLEAIADKVNADGWDCGQWEGVQGVLLAVGAQRLATPAPSPAGGVREALETATEHIARDIREGRFPDRSERQRALFVAADGSLSADWVAMILAEYGWVEDGQIANGPYLAVMIAEAVDRIIAALSPATAARGGHPGCDEQLDMAKRLASNLGYVVVPDPVHADGEVHEPEFVAQMQPSLLALGFHAVPIDRSALASPDAKRG